MKDQPMVEDIRIRYYKSHQKPKMKSRIVEIIVVTAFIVLIIFLWIYGESNARDDTIITLPSNTVILDSSGSDAEGSLHTQ